MNASLADAIRTRVASEVAASLQPHLEILRSLMGAIEAHPTFDRRPGVARSAETATARATPAPKARRRSGHKTSAAAGAGTPGEPTALQQLEAERPSARAAACEPAQPAGATPTATTAGAVAPFSASSAVAALPEKATSALTLPCAPPSLASAGSPDTRGFSIDQPVRLRRPQGFVDATVVQIDPSTGLLELELVDEGRYVRVPAEKVFAAPG